MLVTCDKCPSVKHSKHHSLNTIIKNQILTAIYLTNMCGAKSEQTGIVISTPMPAVM